MLPAGAPEAKAAVSEAEALRRQLLSRAEMRAAADWLEQRPQLGPEVFARSRPEGRAVNRGADITDLLLACLNCCRCRPDWSGISPQAARLMARVASDGADRGNATGAAGGGCVDGVPAGDWGGQPESGDTVSCSCGEHVGGAAGVGAIGRGFVGAGGELGAISVSKLTSEPFVDNAKSQA